MVFFKILIIKTTPSSDEALEGVGAPKSKVEAGSLLALRPKYITHFISDNAFLSRVSPTRREGLA